LEFEKLALMKRAAMGVRMHSGWGALVAVAGDPAKIEVLGRRRIVIVDERAARAKQPYHFAAQMEVREAEQYLRKCAEESEELAAAAIGKAIEEMRERSYRITGLAMLLASGRALPELPGILASHALIHTAEGEFFRRAVWRACERLNVCVRGFRERDLDEQVETAWAGAAAGLQRRIASLGKSIGAPWTEDQKRASLAASIILRMGRGADRLTR
jgi:hypothetical protein